MPKFTKLESKEQWETALKTGKQTVVYFTIVGAEDDFTRNILDAMWKEVQDFVQDDTSETQWFLLDLVEEDELADELKCRALSSFHGYIDGKMVSKTGQTRDTADLKELMAELAEPSTILPYKATSQEDFDKVLEENEFVVVDFTASWCGPCQMIGPKFKEIAKKQRADNKNLLGGDELVKFMKVEQTETKDIVEKAGVGCYPSFYFYRKGEKVDTLEGADDEQLKLKIKTLINPEYVEIHYAELVETKEKFDKIIEENTKAVFVDFTASWCPPCKAIKPVFEALAEKHKDVEKMKFVKIDVDENEEVSQEYSIRSMPTFKVFVDGKEVPEDGFSGGNIEKLNALVKKYTE